MTKAAWTLKGRQHFRGDLHPRPHPHATRTARMADHHDLRAHVLLDPSAASSGVAIVDPDLLQAGKKALDRLEKQRDTLSILDIGGVNDHFEQQSQRVDQQVPFTS